MWHGPWCDLTLIPVSVYVLGKIFNFDAKRKILCLLAIACLHYNIHALFLIQICPVFSLNNLYVILLGGFCFSWLLTCATVAALGCFLSLHLPADSPWLERQELSEITFLNLFWHADQSLITHLLCLILPIYILLKAKLSPTPVCLSVLSFFWFSVFLSLCPSSWLLSSMTNPLRQIKVGWVLIFLLAVGQVLNWPGWLVIYVW